MSDKKEQNPIRSAFRQEVFARHNGLCCVPGCGMAAQDAHHIVERKLWDDKYEDGGYIVNNGAALCGIHHMDAEMGNITPYQLRMWCGILQPVYPRSLGDTRYKQYDKWGHEIPQPPRGEKRMKYPHTPFFRNSPGGDVSEKRENGVMKWESLINKDLVFTVKMDGSNATFDYAGVAARNANDAPHVSFDMLKAKHDAFNPCFLPDYLQFFCEWLYAKHSIHYTGETALTDYAQLFGIFNHRTNEWLGWESVREWAKSLGIHTVPTISELYKGCGYPIVKKRYSQPQDLENDVAGWAKKVISDGHEGIVVRSAYSYPWNKFNQNIAKYVRANHVNTDQHWSQQKVVRNEVKT